MREKNVGGRDICVVDTPGIMYRHKAAQMNIKSAIVKHSSGYDALILVHR